MTTLPAVSFDLPAALAPLTAIPNWVVWRADKAPRRACDPNKYASSSDKQTWSAYGAARPAVIDGRADGVGFVLTGSRIAAFDLDDCLTWTNEGTFVIARQAKELVERCGSYCEVTQSGLGLRIIGYGNGEPVHSKFPVDDWSLEIYRKATRYICMTGDPLWGYDLPLCNIDSVIDQVRRPRPAPVPAMPVQSHGAAPRREDCALLHFVQNGVPQGQRSSFFQLIFNELFKEGWHLEQVEALFERYPDGLAARYRGRLSKEVARSFAKAQVRYGQ